MKRSLKRLGKAIKRIFHIVAIVSGILSVIILIGAGIYLMDNDILSNNSINGISLIGTGLAFLAFMESYLNRGDSDEIKHLLRKVLNNLEEKESKSAETRNTNNKIINSTKKILSSPPVNAQFKSQNKITKTK